MRILSRLNSIRSYRVLVIFTIVLVAIFASVQIFNKSFRVQAVSTNVVISEFRVRGPSGGNDEFIELYNLSGAPVAIGGWNVRGSNNTGGVSIRATITAGTIIQPGCHYLLTNSASGGYSGAVAGDQTYTVGITDDGGIALTLPDGSVIDAVGMSTGSAYKEGTVLASLGTTTASNLDRGYERKPGGAAGSGTDTDNNATDFQLITPSNPQNSSGCGGPTPTPTPTPTATPTPTPAPANTVVISQVYGGGGNTGSTLTNDYIELINHSGSPVSLNGWSVQAWVPSTGTWEITPLTNFTLQPGQYYLVQESQGAGGTTSLPTPDAVGTIAVSSSSTKVALVNNTTLITGICPNAGAAGIVDLIGYGGTDCFEGTAPAPTLSNTTAALRRNEGCFDTNQNTNDIVAGSPNPRNSSTPVHDCTSLSAYGSANPSSVLEGGSTTLTVYVAGGQNPDSTGITVSADLSQIGGSATQSFSGSGSVFTFAATVPVGNSTGMKSLPVTVTDAQSRTTNTNILVSVLPLNADHVTISQVYGGGGNNGATYTNDYVELYNPTASTITITGWSLQYASAAGTSWTNKQPLGGIIGPGEYYLVQLGSTAAIGGPLPVSPNIAGDINISATTGKIALVSNSTNLTGDCPLGSSHIVDFVGYGTGATCHEGSANTPAPNASTAIFRKNSGSLDSDQNGTDFQTGAPNPRRTAPIVELGPWVSGTDPDNGANTVPYDATITVNFSEPVTVDAGWYNITCSVTGAHNSATEAHFGDLKTYAVTPNVSFQFGEQCTVTIPKTSVHDVDFDDSGTDTDSLFEDYTWSFTVVGAGQPAPYPASIHLTMGDPGCGTPFGCASASTSQPNNYLMQKPTYSLSYNRDKGTPNWVSWHLDNSWYGTLTRVDTFRPDPKVDPSWYRVQAFDYSGSGFDRGHMTPNADRDNQNRVPINQETYLMSNMVPQAPGNNQGPWAALEAALRTIADGGKELYIVSGPGGVGGTGSNGGTTTTIANGNITVPAFTWKVALVLPKDDGDDTARVTCSTRTIAVLMPNLDNIRPNPWESYLTTVDDVEQQTGFDFFSNLPPAIQACIEAGTNGTNPPGTAGDSITTAEDTSANITLNAVSPGGSLTYTIVNAPAHGQLTGSGANRSYAPDLNFNGTDSFTFKVNDGSHDSNTSTINITVNPVNDAPSANSQSVTTSSNTPVGITLTGTDVETTNLSFTITSSPSHGSLSGSGANLNYTPASNYAGPDSFKFTVTDTGDGTSPALTSGEATVSITVNDTVAPTITLNGNVISLSPPNHNYQTVNVSDLVASASDNFDTSVDLSKVVIAKVTSDEAENGSSSGNTLNDIVIGPGCKSVQLRSERETNGNGRVYTITFRVTDQAGNTTTANAQVFVANGSKQPIDSGVKYTVNGTCP